MSQSEKTADKKPHPALPVEVPRECSPVNLRSLVLGLIGVVLICGLTPYNDYVANNTYLVGSFLPIGLILYTTLVMLVNAPLWKWCPRWSLSSAELAVILGMVMISCALPSSGLMRYLPGQLVGINYHAGHNPEYRSLLSDMNLPDWIFPAFDSKDPLERSSELVVQEFVGRAVVDDHSWLGRIKAVPWSRWARPAVAWGVLMATIWGMVLSLSLILRRQWVENERLPFPLAEVYLSVIESPRPGRALNALFSKRSFWIAASAVFAVHGFNALGNYFPKSVPGIPLRFSLFSILADPPWSYTGAAFRGAAAYFSVIGIVYFLQTNASLGLWLTFVLLQLVLMICGSRQLEINSAMQQDQWFGMLIPFAITIVWMARGELLMVLRQMLRGRGPGEPAGRYISYPLAGWAFVASTAGFVCWLIAAGATLAGAVVLLVMMLAMFLAVARVLAETGLILVQITVSPMRPWTYLMASFPQSLAVRTTAKSYFLTSLVGAFQLHDLRESIAGFTPQVLRIADGAAYDKPATRSRGTSFILALVVALAVGYLVSGASMLLVEYSYAATIDQAQLSPLNQYGVTQTPVNLVLAPTAAYTAGKVQAEAHSRPVHFTIGAVLMVAASFMRLRFLGWPINPVGLLMVYSYAMQKIWFSIVLGWLAKALILRFGGVSLFRAGRPVFIGLIIGEATAAAFWLMVSLVLDLQGIPFKAVKLLPT